MTTLEDRLWSRLCQLISDGPLVKEQFCEMVREVVGTNLATAASRSFDEISTEQKLMSAFPVYEVWNGQVKDAATKAAEDILAHDTFAPMRAELDTNTLKLCKDCHHYDNGACNVFKNQEIINPATGISFGAPEFTSAHIMRVEGTLCGLEGRLFSLV